jgi:transcriptional regulator with GAF, ATPase, and Fis domain
MVTDEPEVATLLRAAAVDLPEGTFELTVEAGVGAERALSIDGSAPARCLVGTSPVCDLRIDDPSVSRRHLALELRGTLLRVTDLGSTNGTRVAGVAVIDALLSGGETIAIGDTRIRVVHRRDGGNAAVPGGEGFGRLIGSSRAMRRIYPLCDKLARSEVPVLIEGETGTGKEVLAESLHEAGARAAGPFVVFDCTAISPGLIEAELFGHERGAFTGAVAARRGVFEQADGGTLLIDEIGDLDIALQPKLLRALERGEVRRVGGDRWIRTDVRVIVATRRDLDRAVQAGRFRDDLFHRVVVGRVELPPLRQRSGDVAVLAHHFWTSLGGSGPIPLHLLGRWSDAPWPGNVRELRNAVGRAIALGELETEPPSGDPAGPLADLDRYVEDAVRAGEPLARARQRVIGEFERRYLERVLEASGGAVTRAAAAAGVARRHFQRLRARLRD